MGHIKYVGCFDIPGFKGIVETAQLDWLIEAFQLVIRKVQAASQIQRVWGMEPSLGFKVFSDSIFIWTDNDSEDSFLEISLFAQQLITSCVNTGICLRGAITKGELFAQGDIIIGKAIVRSYQLEQVQRWVGCWIDPLILSDDVAKELLAQQEPNLFLKYNIPTKSGIENNQYVVNWSLITGASIIFAKQPMKDAINTVFHWVSKYTDESVEDKKRNTVEFLEYANQAYKGAESI